MTRSTHKPKLKLKHVKWRQDMYEPHTLNINRLIDILSTCRAADTAGEQLIIDKYISSHPEMKQDDFGNYWLRIGDTDTMFSCHTDTVHGFKDDIRYNIGYIEHSNLFIPIKQGKVLGADDGAGMEIMLTMIDFLVPGLYVFHRQEERGGGGSQFFSAQEDILQGISKCIAFDRKGTSSVITHQAYGRCCSDTFADALSRQLEGHGLEFERDDGGTFTDSANYTHLVSECTNLSVGYENQHTSNEQLDVKFLDDMTRACLNLDWHDLPAMRDPASWDDWTGKSGSYYSGYGTKPPHFRDWYQCLGWVMDHPEEAADFIFDFGDSSADYNSDGISINDPGNYQFDD